MKELEKAVRRLDVYMNLVESTIDALRKYEMEEEARELQEIYYRLAALLIKLKKTVGW